MLEIPIFASFVAGLISFLSPCILPIVPGFLSYLAGSSTQQGGSGRKEIFLTSVFFVFGFSLVFAGLGVLLNTVLEGIAYDVQLWLSRIGGIIIIFFGLYLTGLIRIGFLEQEHKITMEKRFSSRYLTATLFGAAFAAGWTPCVGAILGAILGLAATNPGSAFILLMSYALGLGLPFLVVGAFTAQSQKLIVRYGRFIPYINKAFGVLLIVLGVLVFTQQLNRLANLELLNRFLLSN